MPLKKYLQLLKSFDWILLGSVFLLICFSLAALYSIAISFDEPNFGNFSKQITFAIIGFAVLFIVSFIDYRLWQEYSSIFYGFVGILLIGVLFFGTTVRGTTGWYSLLGFNFQPVELAKIALVAFLAWFLSKHTGQIKELKTLVATGGSVLLLFILVMFQPDFGSGIILFSIWILMMIFAGMNKKHLVVLIIGGLVSFIIGWMFLFAPYQKDRITTFFNPQSDPYGRGYQASQAVTAVGAGGLYGRGLGFGSQSQLKFLPASQTDFIFAVIAEELGFLGISLVLFFWGVIFYRLIRAAKMMKDNFSLFFILGTSALFFIHLIINVGMNIGIVPVTGISLPFLSYGGSFLLTSLLLIGIVQGMIIRNQNPGV